MTEKDNKKAKAVCVYYQRNKCNRGSTCIYSHTLSQSQVEEAVKVKEGKVHTCSFFASGTCKNGEKCKYSHEATKEPAVRARHDSDTSSAGSDDSCATLVSSDGISVDAGATTSADGPGDPIDLSSEQNPRELHWTDYADPNAPVATPFCKYHARGRCREGWHCHFRHSLTIQEYMLLFHDTKPTLWTPDQDAPPPLASQPAVASEPAPERPTASLPSCLFWTLGKCRNGDACPYLHEGEGGTAAGTAPTTSTKGDEGMLAGDWGNEGQNNWEVGNQTDWGNSTQNDWGTRAEGNEGRRGEGEGRGDSNSWSRPPSGVSSRNGEMPRGVCYAYQRGRCYRDICRFRHVTADDEAFDGNQSSATEQEQTETETTWNETDTNSQSAWATGNLDADSAAICEDFQSGNCWKGMDCLQRHVFHDEREHSNGWDLPAYEPQPSPALSISIPASGTRTPDSAQTPIARSVTGRDEDLPTSSQSGTPERLDRSTNGHTVGGGDVIKKPCSQWMRSGRCIRGFACRLLHPGEDGLDPRQLEQDDAKNESPSLALATPTSTTMSEPLVQRHFYHCTAIYGLGCNADRIMTEGEQPPYVFIFGLPKHFTRKHVVSLLSENVEVRDVQFFSHPSGTVASIHCISPEHVDDVVSLLRSTEPSLRARKSYHPTPFRDPLPWLHTPKGFCVKATWPAPSASAWIHFETVAAAKAATNKFNSTVSFCGRKPKATYHSPRRGQVRQFAIHVADLPVDTSKLEVEERCRNATLIIMELPLHVKPPFAQIQEYLNREGNLLAFEPVQSHISDSLHAAFLELPSQEAAVALTMLSGSQMPFYDNQPIKLEIVEYMRFCVPTIEFTALREPIERLQRENAEDCDIQYTTGGAECDIWLSCPTSKFEIFTNTAQAIRGVIHGEIMTHESGLDLPSTNDNGNHATKFFWDPYFDLPNTPRVIHRLNNLPDPNSRPSAPPQNAQTDKLQAKFYIKYDTRTQLVRVLGSTEGRLLGMRALRKTIEKVQTLQHRVPVQREMVYGLIHGGLLDLWAEVGKVKIELDVVSGGGDKSIIVRGDAQLLSRVKKALAAVVPRPVPPVNQRDNACPVCLGVPERPVSLACKHAYCRGCLEHLVGMYIGPRFEPLRCLGHTRAELGSNGSSPFAAITSLTSPQRCPTLIPYKLVQDLLPAKELEQLLRSSFLYGVRHKKDEFRFCPTIRCENVLPLVSGWGSVDGGGGSGGASGSGANGAARVKRCVECCAELCKRCLELDHRGLECPDLLFSST